jgi:hypothetical protein
VAERWLRLGYVEEKRRRAKKSRAAGPGVFGPTWKNPLVVPGSACLVRNAETERRGGQLIEL